MVLDLILIGIVLLSAFSGFKKGFAYTFIHTSGWIMSVVIAFVFTDRLKAILESSAFVKEYIPIPEFPTSELMPDILQGTLFGITHDMILSLMAFSILFIGVKILFRILFGVYTSSIGGGVTGFIDGTLGLAIGLLKGVIIVFVILLICIPTVETFFPCLVDNVDSLLTGSQLAEDLYNNNPFIFMLEHTFLS